MSVLIVVAHPDDEVLGCGGTAASLASQGVEVQSCILSSQAELRNNRPDIPGLMENIYEAQAELGIKPPILGDFPNIKFNVVPHIEIVRFIEEAMVRTNADIIFTHHPNDLNNDHRQTSLACQAAARLFQRSKGITPLRALYFMEVLSATDWAFSDNGAMFCADTYYEIEKFINKKIDALGKYKGVMRDFPHPRSVEIIKSLAAYRGGQAGMKYAEAFQTAFRGLVTSDFIGGL